MHRWLQDFAYRTPLNGWIFVVASLFAMFVSLFTICLQATKAAKPIP